MPKINSLTEAISVLVEVKRRKELTETLMESCFPEQRWFIEDPSKMKTVLCTRRAGKSIGAGLYLIKEGLDNPGVNNLYVSLTRESAKKIMFKDVFKYLNSKYDLKLHFTNIPLAVELPNGSITYLLGMDSKEEEAEKALGQKNRLIVIDECQSFRQDLKDIIFRVLKPTVTDHRGIICMLGTPGNNIKCYFHDVTNKGLDNWSNHGWTTYENPYLARQWDEEIKALKEQNPLIVDSPLFKQMYLKQWTIDESKLVYKFSDVKNVIDKLPETKTEWQYIMGVDLGFSPDPSAFVICAFNEYDPHLYVVDCYKKKEMIISDVAERVKYYDRQYRFNKIIIDNANKQAVEELKQRYGLQLEAAEKTTKAEYIEMLNSDLIRGTIKAVLPKCQGLFEEASQLVWDDRSLRRQEHPSCDNHLLDGFLYAWRWAYNYLSTIEPKPTDPHSLEAVNEFWDKESQKVQDRKVKPIWETE